MRISTSDFFQPLTFSVAELEHAKQIVESRATYNYERIHDLPLQDPVFEREAQKFRKPQAWHVSHNGWTVGHFSFWPWLGASDDSSFRSDTLGVFAVDPKGEIWRIPEATFQRLLKSLASMSDSPTDDMFTRWVANWVDQNKAVAQAKLWMNSAYSSRGSYVAHQLGIHLVGEPPTHAPALTQSDSKSIADFQQMAMLWQDSCLKQTSDAFQAALGPAAPRLEALGAFTTSALEWVQEGNSERRLQAMELLPVVLTPLVDTQWTRPSVGKQQAPMAQSLSNIGRLIDEGSPWYEALADALAQDLLNAAAENMPALPEGYQATVLRGLHRLSRLPQEQRPTVESLPPSVQTPVGLRFSLPKHSSQNHFHTHCLGRLLWACGMVEMIDLPRNPEQFGTMDQVLAHLFRYKNRSHQNHNVWDYSQAQGYRSALRGLTGLPLQPSEWMVPWNTLHKMDEGQREIEDWLAEAFDVPGRNKSKLNEHIEDGLSFKQLLDASQTLHRFHQQATVRVAALQTEQLYALEQGQLAPLWEPGGPAHATDGDVSITALLHPVALLKEGKEMSHCVSGYAPECFSGESRIFAFEDVSGERATLEVQQTKGEDKDHWIASQVQLYGIENAEPSLKLKAVARRFVQRLNEEYSQHRWPQLDLPEQWKEQDASQEPVFKQQAKAWLRAKHRGLFDSLEALSGPPLQSVLQEDQKHFAPCPEQPRFQRRLG